MSTVLIFALFCLANALAAERTAGTCRSVGNLQFNSVAPRSVPALSFCHKYRENTCCNRTHGDVLLRRSLALQVAGVADRCVDVSAKVSCSACHPDYGTGRMTSVCPSLCNEWYEACGEDFFTSTMDGSGVAPCTEDSVVCAQLRDIVGSGLELCHLMGFNRGNGVGARHGTGDAEGLDNRKGKNDDLSAAVAMVVSGQVDSSVGSRCYAGRAMRGRGAARGGSGGFSRRRPATETGRRRAGSGPGSVSRSKA